MVVRKEIKHMIVEGLGKDQLVLLKFTNDESGSLLKWKHSKEFEYNHHMYDIVFSETHSNQVWYWCWPDDKETNINRQLIQLTSKELGKDKKNQDYQKRLVNFYSSLYHSDYKSGTYDYWLKLNSFSYYFNNYKSLVIRPPNPPPEAFKQIS